MKCYECLKVRTWISGEIYPSKECICQIPLYFPLFNLVLCGIQLVISKCIHYDYLKMLALMLGLINVHNSIDKRICKQNDLPGIMSNHGQGSLRELVVDSVIDSAEINVVIEKLAVHRQEQCY